MSDALRLGTVKVLLGHEQRKRILLSVGRSDDEVVGWGVATRSTATAAMPRPQRLYGGDEPEVS